MCWHRPELSGTRRAIVVTLAFLGLAACERRPGRDRARADDASRADNGRALQLADPQLYATCDSLDQRVREVVRRGAERNYGRFTGSARGGIRYGCRITASDTLAPDVPQRPLEVVWQSLAARGWTVDQAYVADSPEGSMLGLRDGSVLCVLQHHWPAASDDERAARPEVPVPYELGVECFREAPRQPGPTG
jgi:hypothetical protein